MKTIYVTQSSRYETTGNITVYTVTKLVNSVAYNIGEEISKPNMSDLCSQVEIWKVVVS